MIGAATDGHYSEPSLGIILGDKIIFDITDSLLEMLNEDFFFIERCLLYE
jgi:hypothetical protein